MTPRTPQSDEERPGQAAEGKQGDASSDLAVGQSVEAKYGNSFFDAEVVELNLEDNKLRIKYAYDNSRAVLPRAEVRSKADAEAGSRETGGREDEEPGELAVGQSIEAKWGNSFFDAEVVELNVDCGKVK